MENVEINITPMSLKNGVMGLPIQCCRNWDASGSVEGIFQYAGRKSSITFSPMIGMDDEAELENQYFQGVFKA